MPGGSSVSPTSVLVVQTTTPLIGTVGFFPENYGDPLIKLSLDILSRRQTPPAVFIHHQLITAENVDHLYPNDALLQQIPPASMG